jgi:hypothetical protein
MMNETLDTLWTEYFSEVCATIETEEERELARNVTAMRQAVNALVSEEQIEAIQKYTNALAKMQSTFLKKAFLKGCAFTASFFLEAR